MVQRSLSRKIHRGIAGCHGMDKKSNFELNLQKWVCLRNLKFQSLHIPSQLKNINPLTFPWNTHYYAGVFKIFDCKQSSMTLCQTYKLLSTLTNLSSYGYKSTLYDRTKSTVRYTYHKNWIKELNIIWYQKLKMELHSFTNEQILKSSEAHMKDHRQLQVLTGEERQM